MSQFTFYAYFVGPFSNLYTKIQIEMLELVMNSMKLVYKWKPEMLRRPWITLHRIEVWPQRNSAKSSCFLRRLVDYYLWGGRGRTQVNESSLNPDIRHGSTVNYIIGFLSPHSANSNQLHLCKAISQFPEAPNVNFRKISVRTTIWDLEFSEHLL